MKDDIKALFSLNEIESILFEELFNRGRARVTDLNRSLKIPRPTLYARPGSMQEKVVITESKAASTTWFSLSSPEALQKIFDKEAEEIKLKKNLFEKNIFPLLQKNRKEKPDNPTLRVFEGKEGVKQVLVDLILSKDIESFTFWPIETILQTLGEDFFVTLNKERIKRNIWTNAIWPADQVVDIKKFPFLGFGKDFKREIRIAPKGVTSTMGYWIYGNKVACVSSTKEMLGFIIESKEFAEMLRSQHQFIWKSSKRITDLPDEASNFIKQL